MAIVVGYDVSYTGTCTCRHCASIIRYAKAEVQTCTVKNYINYYKQNYIICPKCGSKVDLFTKQN